MRLSGKFSLLGFREAQAMIILFGYCLFALVAFRVLSTPWALLAILLSITLSPFTSVPWTPVGGIAIWGWPNPLRYLGALILVGSMPSIMANRHGRPWLPIAVGCLWGMFCWLAPENLVIGILGSVMLLSLAWATNTAALKRILACVGLITLGTLLFWLPIIAFLPAIR